MFFEPWAFVCLVSLAGSCGAGLAARFEGVQLTPDRFVTATAIPAVLAVIFSGNGVPLGIALWTFAFVTLLSCLAVIDFTTRTVPDIVSIPMIFLGLLHAQLSGFDTWVFGGFAVAVLAMGILGQYIFRSQSWIGGGDVLLIGGAIAWLGPALLPDLLLLTGSLLCLKIAMHSFAFQHSSTCMPTEAPCDPGMPLAPSLGVAQMLIWFGGPLF